MPGLRKRLHLLVRASGLTLAAAALLPASAAAGPLSPDSPASPNAEEIQTIWWVMLIIGTLLAVAVIGALLLALRGRLRTGGAPSGERRFRGTRGVQLRVGAGLAVLAAAIFVGGVIFTERAIDVEAASAEEDDPLVIGVTGQRWLWRYEYPAPDGIDRDPFSYHELVVPVDRTVELEIGSTDVVHRWWVPALGGMFDAVPGKINRTSFRADEVGTYEGRSTEYSGPAHAAMRARVRVVEAADYDAWLRQQAADIEAAQEAITDAPEADGEPGAGDSGDAEEEG